MQKKSKKKTIIIVLIVFFFIVIPLLSRCGADSGSNTQVYKSTSPATHESQTADVESTKLSVSDTQKTTESILTPDYPDSIDGVDISFSSKINNDTTGRWRLSRVASSVSTDTYAVDYYNHFFADNDEIHWIINFTLNTTTSIRYTSGQLFVTTYEYVDKEELSAKTLGSGMLLTDYMINPENGEKEDLTVDE